MDLNKYLKANNAQKQIDRLVKKYKNKKVVFYGAGEYFQLIDKNYDLSGFNVVGISDLKFAADINNNPTKYFAVAPEDLKEFDFDVIIITLVDDLDILYHLDNKLLKHTKNEDKHIVPILSPTFSYLVKLFFNKI